MKQIFSWKVWCQFLVITLTAIFIISSCSPDPRTEIESNTSNQVSKMEENKSKVIYFFNEVVGKGNEDVVNELLSPNCRFYDAGKIKTTNVQEFIDYLKKARMPFENIKIQIDNITAEENWVAVRYLYHSLLEGESIEVPAMAEFLIEDDKIVEMWRYIPARNK